MGARLSSQANSDRTHLQERDRPSPAAIPTVGNGGSNQWKGLRHSSYLDWDLAFKSAYSEARRSHANILALTDNEIEGTSSQLRSGQGSYNSVVYPMFCLAALLAVLVLILSLGVVTRRLHSAMLKIDPVLTNHQYWHSHGELPFASLVITLGLLTYILVPLFMYRYPKLPAVLPRVNPKSPPFVLFITIGLYCIVPIALVGAANLFRHSPDFLPTGLGMWVGIPIAIGFFWGTAMMVIHSCPAIS